MENNTLPSSFLPTEILPDYSTTYVVNATQYGAGDVGGVIAPTAITGREAARIQLDRLGYKLGETFHAKLNNNIIFEATVTKPGFFSIREQEKLLASGPDEKCKEGTWINTVENKKTGVITYEICKEGTTAPIWINKGNSIYIDGWKYLEEQKETGTGLFIIPNHTKGGIGSHYATYFGHCFVEVDDRPIPEQWELLNQIHQEYGIKPGLVVFSGSKSLHVYYCFTESTDPDTWKRIQRKLILLFKSDATIQNLNREMRFAGFTRKAKGTQQSVEFVSEETYAVEDFEARLNSTGLFPHSLSKDRWDEARPVLKSEAFKSDVDRNAEIKRILSLPEESLAKNARKANARVPQLERKIYEPGSFSIDPNAKPLHWYLAKEAKSLYKEGIAEGGRNDACFRVAAGLLGAKNALERLGIPFTGDPYEMTREFGSRCNPPMDDYEIDACFNSADSRDCDSALPKEILVAIAGGGSKTKVKTKSKPTPEEDALQLELERNLYHELSRIDYEKCRELGIKVTFIEKSHTEFTPEDLNIEKHKISIISSGMGTGKTINAGKALANYSCLYSWFSRRVLAQSAAAPLSLTYIDDLNEYTRNRDRLSFCSQRSYQRSLTPLGVNGALVIDECDDVFDYNFGKLCNSENIRPMILKTLEAQLQSALYNGTAVFMSADVSQKEIDYIKAIAPKGTPIELVVNTYQMPKGKCYFSTDASPEGLIEKILELVKAGEAVYVIDDFKNGYRGCKTLSEYIQQQMPKCEVVTIHGDNSGSHENRDYVEDINESSLTTSLICVSPSVTQGVSLTNGHFKHVFAIINGILTDKKVTQGISRVRDIENTYIWVAEKGVNINNGGGITAGDVNNYYQRNYDARNIHLHSYGVNYNVIKDEWNSPHWELRCKNVAYDNLVMRRLRYWVQTRLEGLGYELIPTEFGSNKDLDLYLKDLWKGIGVVEALKIGDANVLDKVDEDKLIAKIKSGLSLAPSEKADLAKTHIHKVFGEELTAKTRAEASLNEKTVHLTGYAAVAYKNRNNRSFERNLMRNYRLFHGGSVEAAKRDIDKEKAQEFLRVGERFVGDIKWSTREFKMWELFDVKQFFVPMQKFTPLDFYPTYTKMLEVADHIKDAGWIDISNLKSGRVLGELLRDFGYETEDKQITLDTGKRGREYWITQESFDYVTEFINYQLAKKQNPELGVTDSESCCTLPPKYIVNGLFERGSVQGTQTFALQGVQPVSESQFLAKVGSSQNRSIQTHEVGVCSSSLDDNLYQQANEKLSPTDAMMARVSKESKPGLDKDGLPPLHKPAKNSKSSKPAIASPSQPHTPQPSDTGLRAKALARIAAIKARFQPEYDPDLPVAL
ncbi:MAG: primase alpha helix C-terminal domain-containing protein [Nostoc sp.]